MNLWVNAFYWNATKEKREKHLLNSWIELCVDRSCSVNGFSIFHFHFSHFTRSDCHTLNISYLLFDFQYIAILSLLTLLPIMVRTRQHDKWYTFSLYILIIKMLFSDYNSIYSIWTWVHTIIKRSDKERERKIAFGESDQKVKIAMQKIDDDDRVHSIWYYFIIRV